jgi:hypothetical protein
MRREYTSFLAMAKHSYITNLFNRCLGCAQRADIDTLFDNPRNIEERADALEKVAQEEGEEIYRDVGADEGNFVGRTATAECGHLTMAEPRRGRRVSEACSSSRFVSKMGTYPKDDEHSQDGD